MLRSMYSGISGMRVNQTKLDVIGNNIANVGTTAFKSSRVRFQDMFSQNVKFALGPGLNQGGVNPSSVGLGVKLAGIDSVVSQGNMQSTARNLDAAVDGEGFFLVAKGPLALSDADAAVVGNTPGTAATNHTITNTQNFDAFFTRDGSFTLDSDGNLLTSDGLRVLGYSITDGVNESIKGQVVPTTATGTVAAAASAIDDVLFIDENSPVKLTVQQDAAGGAGNPLLKTLKIPEQVYDVDGGKYVRLSSFSIEPDGVIKGVLEDGRVSVLGQIAMVSFKNPAGLDKQGSNLYKNSANSGSPIVRSGLGEITNNNSKGYGDVLQGVLEMSNVDLAEQFTEMIVATRAFQASGKMITNGDEILQDIINLKR